MLDGDVAAQAGRHYQQALTAKPTTRWRDIARLLIFVARTRLIGIAEFVMLIFVARENVENVASPPI